MSATIKLYKKRSDGTIGLKELSQTMFSSEDSFQEALDFYYGEGYCDSYSEAKESSSKKEV